MKFRFVKLPAEPTAAFPNRKSILLPLLPVCIYNANNHAKLFHFRPMVDSGAGVNIFPGEVGQTLGLDIKRGGEQEIEAINGEVFKSYRHEIVLEVGGWKFNSFACFAERDVFPVLGRDGFFDLFSIKFTYPKAEIELKSLVEPLKIYYH